MNERAFEIKEKVLELTERAGAMVHFEKIRRATDLTMFTLYGERRVILALASTFSDIFLSEDLEIIGGEDVTERYALTMVITEKMTKQPIWKHERRNKLLRYAAVHS